MNHSALLAVALLASSLCGCAAGLVYDGERNGSQADCYRIPNPEERRRCLESSAPRSGEYRLAALRTR
jgi:hypothetical protein